MADHSRNNTPSDKQISRMEIQRTAIPFEQFVEKMRIRKTDSSIDLPTDVIHFKCKDCPLRLPLRSDGLFESTSVLVGGTQDFMDALIGNFLKSHYYQEELCPGVFEIDSAELPQNVIILCPGTDYGRLTDLTISNKSYKARLVVVSEKDTNEAICVLYQSDSEASDAYAQFITNNCLENSGTDNIPEGIGKIEFSREFLRLLR